MTCRRLRSRLSLLLICTITSVLALGTAASAVPDDDPEPNRPKVSANGGESRIASFGPMVIKDRVTEKCVDIPASRPERSTGR